MPRVNPQTLPFIEAIDYYRDKVNLPTSTWTDIWEGMHARAFVVAGAIKDELITDFRTAIDDAIAQRTGYEVFRQQFAQVVKKHGWSYNGGEGWRSRVIYHTNLQTSYQAGRYKQLQAIKHRRPYWIYRHSNIVMDPRPEHVSWDGLVLKADDPWWDTHFPPNGWGCKCRVSGLNDRDLARLGKSGPDKAPQIKMQDKVVGIRGPNPRHVQVPEGIDPGWGYNVGQASTGRTLTKDEYQTFQDSKKKPWLNLSPGTPAEYNRPEQIPLDDPQKTLGHRVQNAEQVKAMLLDYFGADTKIYNVKGVPVIADALSLGEHIQPYRSEYIPLIDELMNDPFEVWQSFERHEGTGKIVLRYRIVKAFKTSSKAGLLMVVDASKGQLSTWTMVPAKQLNYMNNQRYGNLIYGRD